MMTPVLATFALLLTTVPGDAQVRVVRYGQDRLVGIAAVDVLVTASPNSSHCELRREGLQEIAAATLRTNQLQATISETARSSFYSVVIALDASEHGGVCATSVTTELVAQVEGVPEADKYNEPGRWGSLLVGYMPLLRETAVVMSPTASHDASVRSAVAAHTERIARQIRAAR